VYSSQYLQITSTLGIIPVPPWLFMAYKTFISIFYKCKLNCDGVQITFIRTGEIRESIQLFIIYTAVSVHSQTTVLFVTITILKTIQARPSNLLGMLRNNFMVLSSKLYFWGGFCMCPCQIYIYGCIQERVNMNSGELTLEFDEPIHTNELSFSELTLTDSSDAQIPTSEQVEPALPTWIAQYFNSG